MDERLRQDAASFAQLFESATEGIIIHRDEQLLAANQQLVDMLGYARLEDLPTSARDIVPAVEQVRVDVYVEQRHDQPYETRFYRADGTMIDVEVAPRVIDYRGEQARVVFVRDISDRKRTEAQLERQRKLLSLLSHVAIAANESYSVTQALPQILEDICVYLDWPVGHAFLYDAGTDMLEDSRAWYLADELRFGVFRAMSLSGTYAVGVRRIAPTVQTGKPLWLEDIRADPTFVRQAAARAAGLQTALFLPIRVDQKIVGAMEFLTDASVRPDPEIVETLLQVALLVGRVVERDQGKRDLDQRIAELEEMQAELRQRALHDELTGLPNRTLLFDRVEEARARAMREDFLIALLFLDLDDFKSVNDTLGHAAGDRLLAAIAGRLRMLVRDGDTVARLGGDEFVILLGRERVVADIELVARRILREFKEPFPIDGQLVWARTSIGVACARPEWLDIESLLSEADAAMYQAKSAGRAQYRFFDATSTVPDVKRSDNTQPLILRD